MMAGNNQLSLCPAEMCAALQYYLDNVVFKDGGPEVKSFSYDASSQITTVKLSGRRPGASED